MDNKYTISEIARMSLLSEKTIRNYMQLGILAGEKISGTWYFDEETVGNFFTNEYVRAAIQTKNNALVFDFLADNRKKEDEICIILDIPKAEYPEEISAFFCRAISESNGGKLNFSYAKNEKNVRVTIKGQALTVLAVVNAFYQR